VIVGTSLTNVGVASGLPAGELVSLRVTAINTLGLGSPSDPITLTASSLPNASTYINVVEYRSANSLQLSWDVPLNTGANNNSKVPILSY
jgi:hypothetical protein